MRLRDIRGTERRFDRGLDLRDTPRVALLVRAPRRLRGALRLRALAIGAEMCSGGNLAGLKETFVELLR